jgi:hypothetical protein
VNICHQKNSIDKIHIIYTFSKYEITLVFHSTSKITKKNVKTSIQGKSLHVSLNGFEMLPFSCFITSKCGGFEIDKIPWQIQIITQFCVKIDCHPLKSNQMFCKVWQVYNVMRTFIHSLLMPRNTQILSFEIFFSSSIMQT